MKFLKNLKKKFEESQKDKKEIKEVQQQAYKEAMKEQAKFLGYKQAELDSQQRIKIYEDKLKKQREKLKNKEKDGGDIFGLNKYKEENKKEDYDWLGRYVQ